MKWPTGGEWFLIIFLWLFFSFAAGGVETWREKRKWDKENK